MNLSKILKGHEGKTFYSLTNGDVIYEGVQEDEFGDSELLFRVPEYGLSVTTFISGRVSEQGGVVVIYPSEELYKRYPLNASEAWAEWILSQSEEHYKLSVHMYISDIELDSICDRIHEEQNFTSKEQVREAVDKIRKCIKGL